jgi:hypothetical protein
MLARSSRGGAIPLLVMAGHSRPKDGVASARLCPAIHVLPSNASNAWMPGSSPGMTNVGVGANLLSHFSPTLNGGSLPGGTVSSAIASIIATIT